MRWLLSLCLVLAAAGLWSWQALGAGRAASESERRALAHVDGAQPALVLAGAGSAASGSGLLTVAYDGASPDGPLTSAPSSVSRAQPLDGAAATRAMVDLRRRMDRGGLVRLADELTERVARAPDDAEALFTLCEASRLLGRVAHADDYSAAAVARFPDAARAHLERARALAEHMKRAGTFGALRFLGDFKAALERSLELDPHCVEARCDRIGFLSFAPGLVGGDSDLALDMARELAEEQPVRGAVMEVVVLVTDGRTDDAVERARTALAELGPGRSPHDEHLRQLHMVLATTLVEDERADEAAEHFARAMDGPDDTVRFQALYLRAKQRLEDDVEHAAALADMDVFLATEPYGELMPFLGAAHWRRGQALEGLGRHAEALAAYAEALRHDPDFDKAADSRDELLDRLD